MIKMPEHIETKRLYLDIPTKPTFSLASEIFEEVSFSRNTLGAWFPWVEGTTLPEHTFLYLTGWCEEHYKTGVGYAYTIHSKETGKFLGMVDLMQINEGRKSAEFGYWLSDRATGNGYMTEAVRAIENVAFASDINRIIIQNDTQNTRSINVAKRCGYLLDGVMREDRIRADGSFRSTNIWSKIKSQWEEEKR